MESPKKIIVPDSKFGKTAFADYYHYGPEAGGAAPFIAYVGGAISEEEYQKRLASSPEAILAEFEKALASFPDQSVDLLIIPCPIAEEGNHEQDRKKFFSFFVFDLLAVTANPRPLKMGMVGFSFGAYLAAGLAFDLPRVKALATLGGTGMAEAAWDSPDRAFAGKKFKSFATANDPLSMESYKFLHALVKKEVDMEPELGPGGHRFEDYANNGFVAQAFGFVLEACFAP